jgi:thioredoxin 1
MSGLQEVNAANWDEEVIKSDKPVLVDFWAQWCGPCKAFMPLLEQVAEEIQGQYKIVKLNVDENPEIAMTYKIKTIPNLIVFKNGEVYKAQVGRTSKENVLKLFE